MSTNYTSFGQDPGATPGLGNLNRDVFATPPRLFIHYPSSTNSNMMSRFLRLVLLLCYFSSLSPAFGVPSLQSPLVEDLPAIPKPNISIELFNDLEELSRIVDISYCVGVTGIGIQKPFLCASRCQDFPSFELVTVSV